ncbi:hypothetical protein [Sporolituus thermophilus]|uniref:Sulphur transport domain-containing protein n=1 Tax=Sporolituus thermophilus DSM 23256 TaxID=1123285 RepID=A0A1G7ME88_9FIRM|nr:hypothetical protein [Sporolituus thermophilus]SDF59439.1 hypothetical protein SAMN05660235_02102 [Sporolituus thermophilus DSM 23256]
MLTPFISLLFGFIIGYMAQRSRMCFIGGLRDYVLVRDTELLKGLFSFVLTAAILFPLVNALGGDTPGYPWYNREKAKTAIELARDYYAFAACMIPDELLLVVQAALDNTVKGIRLPGGMILTYAAVTAIAGGLGIGYLSTVVNGCPLRQHVMAASGNKSARVYLCGFYAGAVVYTYWLYPFVSKLLP